ncbi:predicted protein [Chaetomium globosum CBS 148.51]|uniref:Uncharacterized protein n=1 Tax=Chaetomium globosum (strain ATCC 6205 / CBS 148.51 / DSM 1962 / NBRC 6347 / NRRL 1970) TaxID=306901 RepID=Q2H3T0_CHAGB|nr:uncharacterized protein CHGG_06685 [Chaetomium globosum CBS 148.51]EAQ90066.1 predicted protein [Chaetomium globosum CBS 148.51]
MADPWQDEAPQGRQEGYYPPLPGTGPRVTMPQQQPWEYTIPQGPRRNATTPAIYPRRETAAPIIFTAAPPNNITPCNPWQFGYRHQAGGPSQRTLIPSAPATGSFPPAQGAPGRDFPPVESTTAPTNTNTGRQATAGNAQPAEGTARGGGVTQGPRPPFRPSYMANPQSRAERENPTREVIARRMAAGVSANYRGKIRSSSHAGFAFSSKTIPATCKGPRVVPRRDRKDQGSVMRWKAKNMALDGGDRGGD